MRTMREQPVTYHDDETTMKGFGDAIQGKRTGIVMVHEWWGMTKRVYNEAQKFAQQGYTAFIADMYGDAKTADNPKDAGALAWRVTRRCGAGCIGQGTATGRMRSPNGSAWPHSPMQAPDRKTAMSPLTASLATLFVTAWSAWATTTSPTPSPGATTPPATTGGGIADYWWLILVVIIVAVAIWYVTRRNRTSL